MPRVGPALLAVLVAGCGPSGAADEPSAIDLAPRFPPASTASASPPSPTSPPDPAAPAASTAVVDASGDSTAPAPAPAPALPLLATAGDPIGDVTPGATPAPAWADLAGATLTLVDGTFELRVTLGGSAAPSSSDSANETMNVASFYDLDGDGSIDVEVWANLADGGWGASWFDNRSDAALFGDDAGVAVGAEGTDVVLRFPASHLHGATSFRWSVASEQGTYGVIGTALAARDDVPDGDAPASFPA